MKRLTPRLSAVMLAVAAVLAGCVAEDFDVLTQGGASDPARVVSNGGAGQNTIVVSSAMNPGSAEPGVASAGGGPEVVRVELLEAYTFNMLNDDALNGPTVLPADSPGLLSLRVVTEPSEVGSVVVQNVVLNTSPYFYPYADREAAPEPATDLVVGSNLVSVQAFSEFDAQGLAGAILQGTIVITREPANPLVITSIEILDTATDRAVAELSATGPTKVPRTTKCVLVTARFAETVGSVRFETTSVVTIQNVPDYVFPKQCLDPSNTPPFELKMTAYSDSRAQGVAGPTRTVRVELTR